MIGLIQVEVKGGEELMLAFTKFEDILNDFTQVFGKVGEKFYEITQKRFDLGGPGWPSLKTATEAQKARTLGGPSRILRATDALYDSFKKDAVGNVHRVDKKEAEFGSNIYYGIFHQEGTSRLPQRTIIEITSAQEAEFADIAMDVIKDQIEALGFQVAA